MNGNRRSHRLPCLVAVVGACGLAGCAGSGADRAPVPADVIEFIVPWTDAFPSDVAVDANGRVWFTDRLTHAIGRLDPETGEFTRYATPREHSAPYGLVRGPDGALWFAESHVGGLGRIDPEDGSITEVSLEGVPRGGPQLLAVAAGRIWFTARDAGAYGSYDPRTRQTALYTDAALRPYGIASDGRTRVWISGFGNSRVLEVDGATGAVREHDPGSSLGDTVTVWITEADGRVLTSRERPADSPDSRPVQRRTGPRVGVRRMSAHGHDVWLTDFTGSRVLGLGVDGAVRDFASVNANAEPYGILAATSGRVWYNEKRNDEIVALDPASGERTRYRIPTAGAAVRHLAEDQRRGRIWLALSDRGRIGLIPLRPGALPSMGSGR